MTINPYENDFIYYKPRDIYIAKDQLKGDRGEDAMKKAGIDLKFTEEYIYPPNSKDLERLMASLDTIYPGRKSRVMNTEEYQDVLKWSNENNMSLFRSLITQFEVFYDSKKGLYIVNFLDTGFDDEEFFSLDDFPRDSRIGLTVREVIA